MKPDIRKVWDEIKYAEECLGIAITRKGGHTSRYIIRMYENEEKKRRYAGKCIRPDGGDSIRSVHGVETKKD